MVCMHAQWYWLEMDTTQQGCYSVCHIARPEKRALSVCLVRLILHFLMASLTTWRHNEKMEEQSGYVPPCQTPWWGPIWHVMCTTDMGRYNGKELLEFISKTCRTRAQQETSNCDLPWWQLAKKGGKSLLFTITKQREDALVHTYTQNTIPWHCLANWKLAFCHSLIVTA